MIHSIFLTRLCIAKLENLIVEGWLPYPEEKFSVHTLCCNFEKNFVNELHFQETIVFKKKAINYHQKLFVILITFFKRYN